MYPVLAVLNRKLCFKTLDGVSITLKKDSYISVPNELSERNFGMVLVDDEEFFVQIKNSDVSILN